MFKKILVPIDVDRPVAAKTVFEYASILAEQNNAKLKLVAVMPGFGMPIVGSYITDDVRKEALDHFKEALETFLKENCSESVEYTIRAGKNWRQIVRVAEKWEADLIIVYHNKHREINEAFSRSCSDNVFRNANCSVLKLRNIREK